MKKTLLSGVLALALSACASGNPRNAAPAFDRNNLAREELATRPSENLYTIIRALRPNWLLTPMGASGVAGPSTNPVTVFIGNNEMGGSEALRSVTGSSVESATYYSTTEAQSKYGLRVTSPVIAIVMRRP